MEPHAKETWNLKEIRDYIDCIENLSAQNKKHLVEIVNSIDRYVLIFRYHGRLIYKELAAHFKNEEISDPEKFSLVMGLSPRQAAYEYSWIACEANFISCVHTVRNMYDVFSQIVNSLILNNSISPEKCNILRVKNELQPSTLKNEINKLLESEWFGYVGALSNTIKHHRFIKGTPRITLADNRFELRMNGFEYKGKTYDDYWISDALKGIESVQNQIINCGNILNNELLRGCA